MKKKKFVVFVLFFCLMAFIDLIKVEAKPEYSEIMGIYTISAPVKAPKKVYVEQDVIKYLEDSGIDVRTEVIEESFWFFKKKTYNYFYIANKYVEEIVYTRQISNDVDSMIFMVKELEQRVIEVNGGKLI